MKKLTTSLLTACLVMVLFFTGFSGDAWAYDQSQFDRLKSGVEQWNNWRFGDWNGEDIDLAGADLSGLNLTEAFLRFADLSEANLAGANLHDADLISVKLNKANLTAADLTDAAFSDTDFTEANLTNADLSDYHYVDGWINFHGANLSGANLNSYKFSECDSISAEDIEDFEYRRFTSYSYRDSCAIAFDQAIHDDKTQFPPGHYGRYH